MAAEKKAEDLEPYLKTEEKADSEGNESDASTITLEPDIQVLVSDFSISVDEASALLKKHGRVRDVVAAKLKEERATKREQTSSKKSIFKKKVKFEDDKDSAVVKSESFVFDPDSEYEDAIDGLDVDDFDEIDAPDAAAAAPSKEVRLDEWKEGVPLRRWCYLAVGRMAGMTTATEQDKKLAALAVLAVDTRAFDEFRELVEGGTKTQAALKEMADNTANEFSWRRESGRRQPKWPKYDAAKDTIYAFNVSMGLEKEVSGASDKDAVSAYLAHLTGQARNYATLFYNSNRSCTLNEIMGSVKSSLEKTDTQADFNLLKHLKQENKTVAKFGPFVLEKVTNVLLPFYYTEAQIKQQAQEYFVRGLRDNIRKEVEKQFPPTWDHAFTLARNVEGMVGDDDVQVIAPMVRGKPKSVVKKVHKEPFDIKKVRCHF